MSAKKRQQKSQDHMSSSKQNPQKKIYHDQMRIVKRTIIGFCGPIKIIKKRIISKLQNLLIKQLPEDQQANQDYLITKKHIYGNHHLQNIFEEPIKALNKFAIFIYYHPRRQVDFFDRSAIVEQSKRDTNLMALVFQKTLIKNVEIIKCDLMVPYQTKNLFISIATTKHLEYSLKENGNRIFGQNQIVLFNNGSMLTTNLGQGSFIVHEETQMKISQDYNKGLFLIKKINLVKL